MRNRMKALLSLALALVCSLSLMTAAFAQETIDLSKTGSITLTMQDSKKKPVSGGELTLYQVATVVENDGDLSYAYTNGFENCGVELGDLSASTLAADLQKKLSANAEKTTVTIGTDGVAKFENLPLGLYLVVETKAATGYNAVSSFVVSVPMTENGEYVYDVNATPKLSTVTEKPSTPNTPSTPTTPKLPQTGQLDWPIPVLAVAGVLLCALGFRLRRDNKHEA